MQINLHTRFLSYDSVEKVDVSPIRSESVRIPNLNIIRYPMPPLFHLQARRWPQSSVLPQSALRPHRKFELDAEQILDNRTVRHRGEALTLRTTSNTRLKNVAPLRLRRTASTVSSPPISLLAGSSRHSPARKQPPERSTDMHPRRRGRSQPPGSTSDPHHSRTKIPPVDLTLAANNPGAQSDPGHLHPRKDPLCSSTASHTYSSSHPGKHTSTT